MNNNHLNLATGLTDTKTCWLELVPNPTILSIPKNLRRPTSVPNAETHWLELVSNPTKYRRRGKRAKSPRDTRRRICVIRAVNKRDDANNGKGAKDGTLKGTKDDILERTEDGTLEVIPKGH